jgi:hypothetical protein
MWLMGREEWEYELGQASVATNAMGRNERILVREVSE